MFETKALSATSIRYAMSALAGFVLAVTLVYLTPLKWINIVEPSIYDVAPRDFYAEYVKNPEEYVFIDVRPESAYNTEHATGSISIPVQNMYDAWRILPRSGKKIALICKEGYASGVAYGFLRFHGFFNIERIDGGIIRWKEEGLPTTEGSAANKLLEL